MKIIGLTGGIGSGKTTVAKMFAALGIPIYIADDEARKLSDSSVEIRKAMIELLGEMAYIDNKLNRSFVSQRIFTDKILLEKVNNIIHPRVADHFQNWVAMQTSSYVIKEAAILFENSGYKSCDAVILVTAPKAIRIERVMNRDKTNLQEIENRIHNQWSDSKKRKLAQFEIENIDLDVTKNKVLTLHNILLQN